MLILLQQCLSHIDNCCEKIVDLLIMEIIASCSLSLWCHCVLYYVNVSVANVMLFYYVLEILLNLLTALNEAFIMFFLL